jgi:ribosomal-protein-alanine N-acetyltransferase
MRTLAAPPLLLEPQTAAHAREMFAVLCDPAIYEFENEPPSSEEALTKRYRDLEGRRSADRTQHWLNWVIRLPSGELAGYVQATVLPSREAFVAYELASRHWRKGIGTTAVSAVLEELHARYAVAKYIAVLKSANFRSLALLRKLAFLPATEAEFAQYGGEANERVMVKSAS